VNSKDRETLKLKEMELALARFDAMISFLKKRVEEGSASPTIIARLARLQQLRDDLDVQIRVERIRRETHRPGARPLLHS
jgi:hypothetical protein